MRGRNESGAGTVQLVVLAIIALVLIVLVLFLLSLPELIAPPWG